MTPSTRAVPLVVDRADDQRGAARRGDAVDDRRRPRCGTCRRARAPTRRPPRRHPCGSGAPSSRSTPLIRVCAVNGTNVRRAELALVPLAQPVALLGEHDDRPALGGLVGEATTAARRRPARPRVDAGARGRSSLACRLPSVMVPVLSSSSVLTSPAASTARPDIASTLRCTSRSMPGDADRRQQRADRGRDQADQQGDEHDDRLLGAGVDRERLQGHHGEQEDDRQAGEQDVERDLVRRLLPRRALDQRDHPVDEGLARLGW